MSELFLYLLRMDVALLPSSEVFMLLPSVDLDAAPPQARSEQVFPKGSVRLTRTARVENATNVATLVPNPTESTGLSGMKENQSSIAQSHDFLGKQTGVRLKRTKQACECTLHD